MSISPVRWALIFVYAAILWALIFVAVANAQSAVPGVATPGGSLDLSTIETQILQMLGMLLMGGLGWLVQRMIVRFNGSISAQQQAAMEAVAAKALAFGIGQAQEQIKARGWDSVQVKSDVVRAAATYAISKFPDTIAAVGLDASKPETASILAHGILTRKFPEAVTEAAASPATPPAPVLAASPIILPTVPGVTTTIQSTSTATADTSRPGTMPGPKGV